MRNCKTDQKCWEIFVKHNFEENVSILHVLVPCQSNLSFPGSVAIQGWVMNDFMARTLKITASYRSAKSSIL